MTTPTLTTGAVAREARVSQGTVQTYARLKLVPFIRTSDGRRLFAPDAVEQVRAIYERRMAKRGRSAA